MNRILVAAALVLLAASIGGCREIASPRSGYLIVADTDSPVLIRTRELEGSGWISAYTTAGRWTEIYRNPNGSFSYNQVLPGEAWHCASPYGTQLGCFAVLRVGDEKGTLSTGSSSGRLYVCTADYNDWDGRKKCGNRSIQTRNLLESDWSTEYMDKRRSGPVEMEPGSLPFYLVQDWRGDGAQRLFSGLHHFANTNNAWDPAFPTDDAGLWVEWSNGRAVPPLQDPELLPSDELYSVDVGLCNVFVPWKWDDRFIGGEYTPRIGDALGNLGLGELMVDRLMDRPISQSIYTQNAKKWLDALQGIWSRTEVSPEFHFRVSEEGERQMCMVQYVKANNRINGRPDHWWRFDQGFAALFVQWWGFGDCPSHPARIQYCGEIKYNGRDTIFEIDPETVKATMEPYGLFRPICRKQFKPSFEQSMPQMLIEPAQIATAEGLELLVSSFQALLGASIRRIETTAAGMYLVTAEAGFDSQYGVGDCINEVEGGPIGLYNHHRPSITLAPVPATGITRPVQ